jgi:hypothetical protein
MIAGITERQLMRLAPCFTTAVFGAVAVTVAQADEGMWTFNQFPVDKVKKNYGLTLDQAWLDHVRLASLRINRACSAAFVSPQGLAQTAHHCVESCIEKLSTPEQDFLAAGFYAGEQKDEIRCANVQASQLLAISDVSKRLEKAAAGKNGEHADNALEAEKALIARECAGDEPGISCEVVELFGGAVQNLYRYRVYDDLRLVWAPEQAIAYFGGELTNFEFPRYALDAAFLRVYADGQPLDSSANYLRYAAEDPKPGDVTFASGSPGYTYRGYTVAQVEFERDVALPRNILSLAEFRRVLKEFESKGPDQARLAGSLLTRTEGSLKHNKGLFAALTDPNILKFRGASEKALRSKIAADPKLQRRYGKAWDGVQTSLDDFRGWRDRYEYTAGGRGIRSRLFDLAQKLTRYADELRKPEKERAEEYTGHNLAATQRALAAIPRVDPALEKLTLTFSLGKMREALGPDDPVVRKVLGKMSPERRAAELIDGSVLNDSDKRKQLIDGGPAAIDGSADPMIVLARALEEDWNVLLQKESEREATQSKYVAQIARAAFQVYGNAIYPDANFTLRLSYGSVSGYRETGRPVEPITEIAGLYERAGDDPPFKLPERWLAAQTRLNPQQPFNLVTTNDAVGGVSGAPLINKSGEVAGLVFDLNKAGLGGYYAYDPSSNRTVSISVGALREVLAKVYGAEGLVKELE